VKEGLGSHSEEECLTSEVFVGEGGGRRPKRSLSLDYKVEIGNEERMRRGGDGFSSDISKAVGYACFGK
jgi:hypothetical protein